MRHRSEAAALSRQPQKREGVSPPASAVTAPTRVVRSVSRSMRGGGVHVDSGFPHLTADGYLFIGWRVGRRRRWTCNGPCLSNLAMAWWPR
jgi:hypothetical protein